MMRASMWTSYLIEWAPRDMVTCFAENGWSTLELSDEHGHDLLKEGPPLKVGDAFRRFAGEHGVSFPQGHFYLCTRGIRPEDRAGRRIADIAPPGDAEFEAAMADMTRWIDLFNALGVTAGVLHLGGGQLAAAGWPADRVFARRLQALERVLDYAKGGPTTLCLENLSPGSGVCDSADFDRIFTACGSKRLGICLDTGHANLAGVDSAAFVRHAGSRLKALHVADNLGQQDNHMLPYGAGTVPWPGVLSALREIGYDGLFNFEVPGENRCPAGVRLRKLAYARELAECMIASDGQ
jgi:sugar phosphate isomerase/epimerase